MVVNMVEKLWVIGEGHALRSDAIQCSTTALQWMGRAYTPCVKRLRTDSGKFAQEADPLRSVSLRLRQSTISELKTMAAIKKVSTSELMRSLLESATSTN
jgi:hypothetical protein